MSTANSRKRKQPSRTRRVQPAAHEAPPPDPALFIQAHEADICRGPRAHALALSLELTTQEENGKLVVKAVEGLIRWQGAALQDGSGGFDGDDEEVVSLGQVHAPRREQSEDGDALWVLSSDLRGDAGVAAALEDIVAGKNRREYVVDDGEMRKGNNWGGGREQAGRVAIKRMNYSLL